MLWEKKVEKKYFVAVDATKQRKGDLTKEKKKKCLRILLSQAIW